MEPPTKKECEVRVNLGNISGVRCGRALPCPMHPDTMLNSQDERKHDKLNVASPDAMEGDDLLGILPWLKSDLTDDAKMQKIAAIVRTRFVSKAYLQQTIEAKRKELHGRPECHRCWNAAFDILLSDLGLNEPTNPTTN